MLTVRAIAKCFPKCSRAIFCGFFRVKNFCLKVASISQLSKQVRIVDLLCALCCHEPGSGSFAKIFGHYRHKYPGNFDILANCAIIQSLWNEKWMLFSFFRKMCNQCEIVWILCSDTQLMVDSLVLKFRLSSGCSVWLFTIADWNCREAVCVINWFCIRRILALFKNFWHFDFFLSGEKVRNERSQR